jgi:hypothetical protein
VTSIDRGTKCHIHLENYYHIQCWLTYYMTIKYIVLGQGNKQTSNTVLNKQR